MSDERRPLAAASERLRAQPGFPGKRGRPRKHPDGHVFRQAPNAVSQPGAATSENDHVRGARVQQAPVVALERRVGDVVTTQPALLSVADAARYLGLSGRTVESYLAAGILTPVRLPSPRGARRLGRVLVERVELDGLVARARP